MGALSVAVPLQRSGSPSFTYVNYDVENTPVNSIDLPVKLYDDSRKGFATRPVKVNSFPQTICAKRLASRRPGRKLCVSAALPVGG